MEPYRSAAYLEMERDKVFTRTWLIMGASDVANVGDYIVKEVEICGGSILITRGAGDKIRAFHNVVSRQPGRVGRQGLAHDHVPLQVPQLDFRQ